MFLINHVKEEDFFINGKPVDTAMETVIEKENQFNIFSHIFLNCISVINKNFDKKACIKKYKEKWKALENGENGLKENERLESFEDFLGFNIYHLTQSYKKTTFIETWEKEKKYLGEVSSHKFRSIYDVCQYVFRYWQIAKGNFEIRKDEAGKAFMIDDNSIDEIVETIKSQKYKQICMNDNRDIKDFEVKKKAIQDAFESILPEKSSFEI